MDPESFNDLEFQMRMIYNHEDENAKKSRRISDQTLLQLKEQLSAHISANIKNNEGRWSD